MFNVVVSFPFDVDFIEKGDLVEDALGECCGSGAGFGMRDMEFEAGNEEEAKAMVEAALAIEIEGIVAEYYPG